MASELRILRFKLGEVGTALRGLAPRLELEIPEGDFASASPGSEQDSASTSFAVGGDGKNLTVTNGELAASLILHCQNAGIPLPREGKKEIYVSGKFIALRIGIRHMHAPQDADSTIELNPALPQNS